MKDTGETSCRYCAEGVMHAAGMCERLTDMQVDAIEAGVEQNGPDAIDTFSEAPVLVREFVHYWGYA